MTLNVNKLVVDVLRQNQGIKMTAKEIAHWIFANHKSECEEKRRSSKQNLTQDTALIQQISAEIAANRPVIQRQARNIKTTETRPMKYYYWAEGEVAEVQQAESRTPVNKDNDAKARLLESELYPIAAMYLHSQYNVFAKRIDEKASSNTRGPNGNRWLFPDLVGMEDLGAEWDSAIQKCVKEFGDKRARLWSFEVKVLLNRSNVRESWFQAVSNSSWANYGYLVASQIATDVIKELRMLSAVHGIGVILLDIDNPAESEILIPAKERLEVDWDSCNRLVEENKDFKYFVDLVRHFHQTGDLKKGDWSIPDY